MPGRGRAALPLLPLISRSVKRREGRAPEDPAGLRGGRGGTFVLQCCYLLAVLRQNVQDWALEGSWNSGNGAQAEAAPKKWVLPQHRARGAAVQPRAQRNHGIMEE